MKLLHGFDDPAAYRGGFVSIGNFDGVHRGHQSMVARLLAHARADGVPAVVFTFDPHPIAILRPEHAPPPLATPARKIELLQQCGVDCVIAYPTDRALLQLTPDEFFQRIVVQELQSQGLVEGPNFFYGHDRTGNSETLRASCAAFSMQLEIVPPVRIGERLVSSSMIRGLIAGGNVAAAAELLGYRYQVRGLVSKGAERGRTIGFPTANLTEIATLLPADGVYGGRAFLRGAEYLAAINIGPNPTFDEHRRKLEVHLLDFSEDLYGAPLEVAFTTRIRDTVRFDSKEQLIAQLKLDTRAVRALANERTSG
jgi:riboflavin kinase / FMN adenylyltransferase